jgi:hypothetical protein
MKSRLGGAQLRVVRNHSGLKFRAVRSLTRGGMEPMAAVAASPGVTAQEMPENLAALAVQTDGQVLRAR